MISGLSHVTFITRDLEKKSRIVVEVLGGKEIYASDAMQHSISAEVVRSIWMKRWACRGVGSLQTR